MGNKVVATTLHLISQIYTHWKYVPLALSPSYIYVDTLQQSVPPFTLSSLLLSLNISLLFE